MTAPGGVIATVYVRVLPAVRNFAQNLRQDLRASQRELRGIDRELRLVEEGFRRVARVATGLVPGIRLARQSLLALGGHAVVGGILSAAGAITTMSGALLLIPAGGVAASAALATLVVGLHGVKDALKDFEDEESFNEALEKLSGNASDTLGVLNEFRSDLSAFQESVQDRLFAGLEDVARDLATTYMPILTDHFGNLADIINLTAKDLAAFATSAGTLRDVDEITRNVETTFSTLRLAAVPIATAFRDIATVGSRALPEVASEVVTLANKFRDFIAVARATGQLDTWIHNAIEAIKQLGRILFNVGRIIAGVLGAAQESGNGLLDTLERVTDKLADMVESTRGQENIKAFLDSAREAGQALLPVIQGLADLIFLHVVPLFERFAKAVGPAVAEFFYALGDALDVAAPGIVSFAAGFASFIQGIIPALPVIARVVSEIGEFLGTLASGLGPAIADVATTIGNVLIPILQLLTGIFDVIGPAVLRFAVVIGTVIAVLGVMTTVVRGVQTLMGTFAGGLSLVTGAAQRTQGGLRGIVGFLSGPWGLALGAATLALGLFMSSTDEATTDVNGLADAMINASGSARDAAREWARQKLEQDGVADTAGKFRIRMDELVDAYLGVPNAAGRVIQKMNEYEDVANANGEETLALMGILSEGPSRYKEAQEAVERKTEADRREGNMAKFVTDALAIQKGVMEAVRLEKERQRDAALAATNSELAYRNTLARTGEQLATNNTTLDINTQEGRDNLGVLTELASAGARRIQDLREQKVSTDVLNTAIQQNEDAILGLLQPFFTTREAARKYAEQIGLIPKAPVTTPVFNDAPARSKMSAFQTYLSELLKPRTVDVTIVQNAPAGGAGLIGQPPGENASGGYWPAGRWTWVGEKGPELVRFGSSARIYSNDESMSMARDVATLDTMTRGAGRSAASATATLAAPAAPTQVVLQPTFTARVFVGSREITDIVRVELAEHDQRLTRAISAGTGRRR